MKKLILQLYALCVLCGHLQAATVEAEGRAPGDMKTAREQALADALREAVRVGTGVDVLSSTGVSDFTLDYDRILSSAFGHVKSYKVISSGLGKDQIYTVKVKAEVEKALRMPRTRSPSARSFSSKARRVFPSMSRSRSMARRPDQIRPRHHGADRARVAIQPRRCRHRLRAGEQDGRARCHPRQ
jgi:hypothetical protein